MSEEIRIAILAALDRRGLTKTVCPSEIARELWPDDWQPRMDDVRSVASSLKKCGLLEITQKSSIVDIAVASGPIRLRPVQPKASYRWQDIRFGLCCQFAAAPIPFRTTTATSLMRLPREGQLSKLSTLCLANSQSLFTALHFCADHQIGAFRINSALFPCKTHPVVGYELDELLESAAIRRTLAACREFARTRDIRTTFHPDQFVVLNSTRPDVVERSLEDLAYHAELAELVGADVINIHGGGSFGDKPAAIKALIRQIKLLPASIRSRLTLENDDRVFSPSDLLPICHETGVPLVYDVHHHRCLKDELTIEAATSAALKTWTREPLFHISSPLEGWAGPRPERHHDRIDPNDFPACWRGISMTVDIEAKAKELATATLIRQLSTGSSLK